MVSTLLSSLTDLLTGSEEAPDKKSSSSKKKPKRRSKERKPEVNDNASETSIASNSSAKGSQAKSAKGKESKTNAGAAGYVNAESLDRAIVNRLQSKVSFTSSAPTQKQRESSSGHGSRRDAAGTSSNGQGRQGRRASEPCKLETNLLTGEKLFPDIHSASHIDFSVLKDADTTRFKPFSEQDTANLMQKLSSTGENKSVVYKNAQFNLENASRETLLSEAPLKENILSDTLMQQFGIPDPSLYRHPTFTASNEALNLKGGSNESVRGNTFTTRNRSGSPRPHLRSPLFASAFSGSNVEIGDHLFESTMNEIIEKGGDDFKNKYSTWVWEAFRSHLIQLKSLLLNEFNQKMKATLNERENEVIDLQQQYREKLAEFDVTTEGFQKLIDNLYHENQRVLKAKDNIIEKLKKEFLECRRHFEHDLIRQMQSYRKEAEVEKLELQKRNDELMMIMLTDASKSGLEDAFKREIESLHKMIKALTTQNEVLHQQLEEATSAASLISRKTVDAIQTQLDQSTKEIAELRKRLQTTERDKEDLVVSHNEEIAKLNRKMQESSTRYDHQLRDAAEEIESLRKRFHKEAKELKQRLQTQELHHGQVLNQVKQQYGGQVESLSRAVSQLQSELTMNAANKRFPQAP